ncbi:MAG: T9SS type A sorting domain-containing protein [Saprospiraceae bacterium]
MKKVFTLILFIFSLSAYSQVSVNQHPEIGNQYYLNMISHEQINFTKDIKPIGGNLKWILKSDSPTIYSDTVLFLDPKTFKVSNKAVGANLAIRDPNAFGLYSFYTVSNNDQYLLGFTDDDVIYTKLDDKYLTNKFPLNYEDSFDGQSTFTIISPLGNEKIEVESFSKVDSWGEITTNAKTYQCLRVKATTTFQGSVLGIPSSNGTVEEYKWITPEIDYDIFRYIVSEFEINGNLSNDTSAFYLVNSITQIKDQKSNVIDIQLSPNPTKDIVWVSIPENKLSDKSKIEVYNINSEIVFNSKINSNQLKISVTDWPRGTYMVKVCNNSKIWGLKKLILE